MYGFISDSDDDKAVEEVLSQAMDLTILEQVANINCAGFNDSDLPSNLETRFQKLKSFPSSTTKNPTSLSTKSFNLSQENKPGFDKKPNLEKIEPKSFNLSQENKPGIDKKPNLEKIELSPAKSSETGSFSPFKKTTKGKLGKKENGSSPSSFWDDFSSRSVSPPAKVGCFLCSPKKVLSRKKSKGSKSFDLGVDWGKNDIDDEFLADLSNFSSKSRKKLMKKAMDEEEKVCKEAEKIVKWAKQASARMEVSDIEDEFSDAENHKFG